MTDESKATPRPWRVAEESALDYRPSIITTADDKSRIALMYSGGPIRAIDKAEERANAALIVAAVNEHDALVAERSSPTCIARLTLCYLALKHDYDRLRQALEEAQDALRGITWQNSPGSEWSRDRALARIREALDDDDLEEEKK